MSGALKVIGKIAGAVAAVAGIIGTITGNPLLLGIAAVAGAVSTIATLGAQLLAKPPPARGSVSQTIVAIEPPQPYGIGEGYLGGVERARAGYGATLNKVPNPYLGIVHVYSGGGPVQSITPWVDFAAIGSWFTAFLFTSTALGLCPEAAAMTPNFAGMPGWDSTSKLSGQAAILWNAKFDKDGKRFANGLPVLGAYGQWVKVYDPRLDSTFPGGSGAHRIDDESTWEWSDNPALHALTYAYGRHQNGKLTFGPGMPVEGLDVAGAAAWASVCEANGWTAFGRIFEPGDTWNNLKDICAAGGGKPLFAGGKVSWTWSAPRIALDTVTEADLAEGELTVTKMKGYRDRLNALVPKYTSDLHNWDQVSAEPVVVAEYVVEDGEERRQEWPFNLVKDAVQAGQLARYVIEDSREQGPIVLPLNPRFRAYRPGECLELDIPALDLSGKAVIVQRSIDPASMTVTLTLVGETDAKHAAALGTSATPPPIAAGSQTAQERDELAAAVTIGAVDSALGTGGGAGYVSGSTSSTTLAPVGDVLEVIVGASGTVNLSASYAFDAIAGSGTYGEVARWYDVTSGSTALDTGTTASSVSSQPGLGVTGEGGCSFPHTGQTVGATKRYQLWMANATGSVTRVISGTCSASST